MDPVNSGGAPCFIAPNWCDAYPVAPNPERDQTGVLGNVKAASLIFRSKPDPTTNPDAEFNAKLFYLKIRITKTIIKKLYACQGYPQPQTRRR